MAALHEEHGRKSGEESEDDGGDDEYRDHREVFGDTDIPNDPEWSSS